ncbi:hypothetical protein [Paenibacillus sp. GCM10028914]|uniref:hypothetical protein n=1 Tax=Paenibacillus sp. GCM10028914 TaxID=3273416 RepID=UPI0036D2DEA5
MKKRTYLILLFILCIIGFVFINFKYIDVKNKHDELQKAIDDRFRYQLSNVQSSFGMEVNDYTYRFMLSSVSNAVSLSELTTFEDVNDELDVSLHSLYVSLREERSKDKTLLRIDEIREIFSMLVLEPTSKEATDKLFEITKETFFNVED